MAEKLEMMSKDIIQENIDYIANKFPNALKEVKDEDGKLVKKIDFDILKQELSREIIDDKQERYQMTWPGKKQSIINSNQRSYLTLRPNLKYSVNFENTKNIFISGDNIEGLKLIRETYLGKVKMIYLDPPYNTGNDFIYNDNFAIEVNQYLQESGQLVDGVKMVQNLESSGKYHSNWLSMIYPRLKLARDLLTDDGIIFISIDDNEVANLKKICDEIFNEKNFIAQIVVEGTPKNDPKIISTAHEYCLVYTKNYDTAKDCEWGVNNPIYDDILCIYDKYKPDYRRVEEELKNYYSKKNLIGDNIANYKMADEKGVFRLGPIDDPQSGGSRETRYNPYTGLSITTPSSGWRCNAETWAQWVKEDLVYFPEDNTNYVPKRHILKKDN